MDRASRKERAKQELGLKSTDQENKNREIALAKEQDVYKRHGRFRSGEELVAGHAYGQEQGHQQNLDDGV